MELFIVLTVITLSLILLFLCTGCCVVRCFRPENSRGPLWFSDADGKPQRVVGLWEKRGEGEKGWLEKADEK